MRFQTSFFERLTAGPDATRPDAFAGVDIAQLKKLVALDLERLLNTRRCLPEQGFDAFPMTERSVFNFGVPDFAARSLSSGVDRDHICSAMAEAIERHDQRLKRVMVQLREERSEVHRLAFDIHAILRVVGFKDEVSFDAQFDSAGMYYQVKA